MKGLVLALLFFLVFPSQTIRAEGIFGNRLNVDLDKPLYFGLEFGLSWAGLPEGSSVQGQQSLNLKTVDDSDLAYGLVMGMRYSEYIDLEMRYQNAGSFEHHLEYIDTLNAVQVDVRTDVSFESLVLAVKPSLKMGKVNLGVELGAAYLMEHFDPKVTASGTQSAQVLQDLEQQIAIRPETERELSLTYGLFIGFKGDGKWEWRYSAQTMSVEDDEFTVHGISFIRHFAETQSDVRPGSVQVASRN